MLLSPLSAIKSFVCYIVHLYPKGDLNIFLVILSFFRLLRYGKNDLSRSRGILSPGAPIVSMVVYVVVKIRSQIDGLASWERIVLFQGLVVNWCGRFLTESAH